MKRIALATTLLAVVSALPADAPAWEATTTHAGLTEQAATASKLHERLRTNLGVTHGLFEPLTVPPADAPALFKILRALNPTHGYVPDGRGRLSALGWLVAGAVVAESPATHMARHFFDPLTGTSLSADTVRGLRMRVRRRALEGVVGKNFLAGSITAPDWAAHRDNPMGLAGFVDQYAKAVRAQTPAERSRHTAGALLAAGSILHLLQDMGSPSRVRNDLAAHLDVIGNDRLDVGSRFERVASLAYGRLGVPYASRTVTSPDLRGFFTTTGRTGLADWTNANWFSPGTLPRTLAMHRRVDSKTFGAKLRGAIRRPTPLPLPRLDLMGAAKSDGVTLVDNAGVCLARYHLTESRLVWSMDNKCMLEQLAVILPEVSAYSAGLLDWLFRGSLALDRVKGQVVVSAAGANFARGTVELFWDDERGVRTAIEKTDTGGGLAGAALAKTPMPANGARVLSAVFVGVDPDGNPLVAAGRLVIAAPKK